MRIRIDLVGIIFLALAVGCTPRKPVTERDRKEAAHLVSEAQFAMTMREWTRAEELLAKAVRVAPTGDYWMSLGATRVRLKNRAAAKDAYQAALKAFESDAGRSPANSEPWLKQVYALALLGRLDDSRALLEKAAQLFPNDRNVRALLAPGGFDRMVSSQNFKDTTL